MQTIKSHELAKLLLSYPDKDVFNTNYIDGELMLNQVNGIDFGLSDKFLTLTGELSMNYESYVNLDSQKIVLIDCDGVILKWGSRLREFASNLGIDVDTTKTDAEIYTTPEDVFLTDRESANELVNEYHKMMLDCLLPYHDTKYINESDCKFVVVTAIGTDPELIKLRWDNLQFYFKDKIINLMCCEPNESKLELFNKAKELYGDRVVAYIDDLTHHIEDCKKVFNIPCYHITRGEAVPCDGNWESIRNLNEVNEIVNS